MRETMNCLINTEETDTQLPLAELLQQFWQLKDQFTSLKSTNHQSTSTTELTQLTEKNAAPHNVAPAAVRLPA